MTPQQLRLTVPPGLRATIAPAWYSRRRCARCVALDLELPRVSTRATPPSSDRECGWFEPSAVSRRGHHRSTTTGNCGIWCGASRQSGVVLAGVLRGRTSARASRLKKYRAHGAASLAFNVLYHAVSAAGSLPSVALAALYRGLHTPQGKPALAPLVEALGARVIPVERFSDPSAGDALRALGADLGVVWGTPLLKPELFEVPRLGCVNIHLAALPRYRGAGDVGLSEVLDGLAEVGVTVHRVDAGLDTGAILGTGVVAIEPYDTLRSLHVKAVLTAHRVCADVVTALSPGRRHAAPAADMTSAGFPMRRSADRLTLNRRHRQFQLRQRPPIRGRWMRFATPPQPLLVRDVLAPRQGAAGGKSADVYLVCDAATTVCGVSTDEFIDHLEHLTQYHRVGSLDDVVANPPGLSSTPVVALTFEDGYAENAGMSRFCALCRCRMRSSSAPTSSTAISCAAGPRRIVDDSDDLRRRGRRR